jgi:lysophospholipase L1-like esterase
MIIDLLLIFIAFEAISAAILFLGPGCFWESYRLAISPKQFKPPFEYDPILGFRYKPSTIVGRQRTGKQGNVLHGEDTDITQPNESKFRILMFGGSAVAGSGASTEGTTLPAQLEKKLRENYSKPIEVINCGVGGYTSLQSLLYFIKISKSCPDLVVVYDGWNDLVYSSVFGGFISKEDLHDNPNTGSEFYYYLKSLELNRGRHFAYFGFSLHLFISSLAAPKFIRLIAAKLGLIKFLPLEITQQLTPYSSRYLTNKIVHDPKEAAETYKNQVKSFHACLKGYGIPTAYFLQPSIFDKDNLSSTEKNVFQTREIMTQKEKIIQLYSLARATLNDQSTTQKPLIIDLIETPNKLEGNDCFSDECHMTDDGYEYVAEDISNSILPLLNR